MKLEEKVLYFALRVSEEYPPVDIYETEKAYFFLMAALDYLAGMTDHYATEINRKILGLGV